MNYLYKRNQVLKCCADSGVDGISCCITHCLRETCVVSAFTELTDRNTLPSLVATSHVCLLKLMFRSSVRLAAFHRVFSVHKWMETTDTAKSSVVDQHGKGQRKL